MDRIIDDLTAEIGRADILHKEFPTIQHAGAVLRRECEEAWAEVWLKPVNRAALRMELLHVAASAARFIRLLDADASLPEPGPFAKPHPMMDMQDEQTAMETQA